MSLLSFPMWSLGIEDISQVLQNVESDIKGQDGERDLENLVKFFQDPRVLQALQVHNKVGFCYSCKSDSMSFSCHYPWMALCQFIALFLSTSAYSYRLSDVSLLVVAYFAFFLHLLCSWADVCFLLTQWIPLKSLTVYFQFSIVKEIRALLKKNLS